MTQEQIKREMDRLKGLEDSLKAELKELPEGRFFASGHPGKWFCYREGKKVYLPKKERELAKALVLRRFREQELALVRQEQEAMLRAAVYLERHAVPNKRMQHEDCLALYSEAVKPLNEELADWSRESFEANPQHPDKLLHRSVSGHILRSKSEAMIDTELFRRRIPFRYECRLDLGGRSCYPDFTVRHPRTGQVFLWEHFGLMDSPEYARNAALKLQTYILNGYIPNVNLILTCETQSQPLGTDRVAQLIHEYFD